MKGLNENMGRHAIEIPVTNGEALTGFRLGPGFDSVSSHNISKSNFPEKITKKTSQKSKVK